MCRMTEKIPCISFYSIFLSLSVQKKKKKKILNFLINKLEQQKRSNASREKIIFVGVVRSLQTKQNRKAFLTKMNQPFHETKTKNFSSEFL